MAYSPDKKRISLFADENLVKRIDDSLNRTDCKSRNEFILEAVKFYLSYLYCEEDATYLVRSIDQSISSSVKSMEDRTAKLIFKLAVEMSMMMNIFAANLEIDEEVLKKLRGKCVQQLSQSLNNLDYLKIIK
ncbi:MAG: hypothetical protein E7192_01905 [Erysipelotrichaceae bacterium]|nr:hypothetical protein [Erysipelotrichaceae bacterium]